MAGQDDERCYITFYGYELVDFPTTFSTFVDHKKILDTDYANEACTSDDSSVATGIHEFIYPYHLKKKYFIEGVAKGHVTFAADQCEATIKAFRVSIWKINGNTDEKTELFTTNWVQTDYTLAWDAVYGIGEEKVFQFRINCWEKATLDEFDRFYIRVETDTVNCTDPSCDCMVLMHSNDSEWEDLKIEIPFRL